MAAKTKRAAGKAKTGGKSKSVRAKPAGARGRGGASKRQRSFPVKSLLVVLSLLVMLLVTVGTVGYVIFFRTVLTDESQGVILNSRDEQVVSIRYFSSTQHRESG